MNSHSYQDNILIWISIKILIESEFLSPGHLFWIPVKYKTRIFFENVNIFHKQIELPNSPHAHARAPCSEPPSFTRTMVWIRIPVQMRPGSAALPLAVGNTNIWIRRPLASCPTENGFAQSWSAWLHASRQACTQDFPRQVFSKVNQSWMTSFLTDRRT